MCEGSIGCEVIVTYRGVIKLIVFTLHADVQTSKRFTRVRWKRMYIIESGDTMRAVTPPLVFYIT